MQLIERLTKVGVNNEGKPTRTRETGLFLCPKCKQAVERNYYNGQKNETCGKKGCQRNRSFRHGYVGKSIYTSWANMKVRCDKPSNVSYARYGGRGITYPDKWATFRGFAEDMLFTWKDGLTIDRKDVNKNYSKDNCQWISMNENRTKDQIKTIVKLDVAGNIIKVYASAADAVRAGECKNSTSITRVARGKRKSYKGFVWKYT